MAESQRRRKRKKERFDGYKLAERGAGAVAYYGIELLVDVLIIFLLAKGFAAAFGFGYDVFTDSALDKNDKKSVVVDISSERSTSELAETLEESGIIENKYVLLAKMKISGYDDEVVYGKYGLSPSMTYDEIIATICHTDEEGSESAGNKIKVDNPSDSSDVSGTGSEASPSDAEGSGDAD